MLEDPGLDKSKYQAWINGNGELTLRLTKGSRVQNHHHSSKILKIFQSQRRKEYYLGDQPGLREYFRQNCSQDGMLHSAEDLLHGNLFGTQAIRTLCFSRRDRHTVLPLGTEIPRRFTGIYMRERTWYLFRSG